ncbi:MAG: 16S rRNA (cytidine(1402)-2'-O)-methyltransferase [Caldilineales bacterium]|nr:16S rRNA (cytidine(1402)-2'-O)-methyltransferase [Caldilineales bacterium]
MEAQTAVGTLYLVSTPIGNLEDITLRALRILQEVNWVAAEDTRHSGRLLKHYEIQARLLSMHEHNEDERVAAVMAILAGGESVALISDAGTPTLSDPGFKLVRAASDAGYDVVPIPGASALLAALVASGLPTDRFLFLGFPPRKPKARAEFLTQAANEPGVLALYESARRLPELLRDIAQIFGENRQLVVARELTKLHETFWRGRAGEAVEVFSKAPLGEVVVLVEGATAGGPVVQPEEMEMVVDGLLAGGMRSSEIARLISGLTGAARRDIYRLASDRADNRQS